MAFAKSFRPSANSATSLDAAAFFAWVRALKKLMSSARCRVRVVVTRILPGNGRAPGAVAAVCAVGWAYVAVFAIRFHVDALIGPAAAGFVLALFCAAAAQQFDDEGVEVVGEGHQRHQKILGGEASQCPANEKRGIA